MRALFPGRFQPFHRGHRAVVEAIAADVDEVIVGIGSAQASHTGVNPFTAGERASMINRAVADVDATTYTIPIEDTGRYAVWPAHVQALCPPFQVIYTNNPVVDRVCRESGLEVRGLDAVERDRYRGTEVRRRMVADEPWRDLVLEPVAEVVEEIDGVARLRQIVEHDEHAVAADS